MVYGLFMAQPHVPMWIGAKGERGLRVAAAKDAGLFPSGAPPPELVASTRRDSERSARKCRSPRPFR